jgi:hypothetical protein
LKEFLGQSALFTLASLAGKLNTLLSAAFALVRQTTAYRVPLKEQLINYSLQWLSGLIAERRGVLLTTYVIKLSNMLFEANGWLVPSGFIDHLCN